MSPGIAAECQAADNDPARLRGNAAEAFGKLFPATAGLACANDRQRLVGTERLHRTLHEQDRRRVGDLSQSLGIFVSVSKALLCFLFEFG